MVVHLEEAGGNGELLLLAGAEDGAHLHRQLVHVQRGGVDDQIRHPPVGGEHLALPADALEHALLALQRVGASHRVEAAHEGGLVGGADDVVDALGARPFDVLRAVVARGLVDSARVGHIGHSWGGYEAAVLPTRTNIFVSS